MKVNTGKNKKNGNAKPKSQVEETAEEVVEESAETVEATDDTETEAEETEADESGEAEEAPTPAPAPAAKAAPKVAPVAPPSVSARPESKKDWVQFACTREIDPAPVVGHQNVGHILGVRKLVSGGRYTLPRNVAMHLADCGAGIIG